MQGRKPVPTALKVIRGNPGKRPFTRNEPQPTGDLEEPPDYLTPSQQDIWREAVAVSPSGLLKKLDASIFETWVVAEDIYRTAALNIAKLGSALLVRSPSNGMLVPSPVLAILNRQALIKLRCAAELGFSPTARARISLNPEEPQTHWTELKKA